MPAASRTSDRAPSPTAVCATCRGEIAALAPRHRCSVSACNAGRFKLRFCSVACFERHVPTARHRGASCIEVGPEEVYVNPEAVSGDSLPGGLEAVQAAGTSTPAAIASVGATVPPSRR
jgi:hypothetical protein